MEICTSPSSVSTKIETLFVWTHTQVDVAMFVDDIPYCIAGAVILAHPGNVACALRGSRVDGRERSDGENRRQPAVVEKLLKRWWSITPPIK